MTQKEIDRMIATTKPQIMQMLEISNEEYLLMRYEMGFTWLECLGYNQLQQVIISKSETYWAHYHTIFLGREMKVLRRKNYYEQLTVDEKRLVFRYLQIDALPEKIPGTALHHILQDVRKLYTIKRLMIELRKRISQHFNEDYRTVKGWGRKQWEEQNHNIIITDETWELLVSEVEEKLKAHPNIDAMSNEELAAMFGDILFKYKPEEIPKTA